MKTECKRQKQKELLKLVRKQIKASKAILAEARKVLDEYYRNKKKS